MKKIFTILGTLGTCFVAAQSLPLPITDTFSYPDGNLLNQGGWVLVGSAASDEIQVVSGAVKFDGAGSDLQKNFSSVNSGTVSYTFDLNITDISKATDTNGGYIAGFLQSATGFGGTLWVKKASENTFYIGIETRTATGSETTWTSTAYDINTVYKVGVDYNFVAGDSNDSVNLYVNGSGVANDTHSGTDLTSIVGFFLRQDSTTETPFVTIDNLTLQVGSVLAATDTKIIKHRFIKNSVIDNAIEFTSKTNVKIYNVSGQLVKSAAVNEGTSLDVSALAKGVYVVTGEVDGQSVSQKIIKK